MRTWNEWTASRLLRRATQHTGIGGRLSPELEIDAARRLGAFALAVTAVSGVMETLALWERPHAALALPFRVCLVALSLSAALGLHLAVSRGKLSAARALDLGIGFEIANGLVFSILFHAASLSAGAQARGWTSVSVWILLYPLIVPTAPRRVVLASLGTALMDPLGLWINVLAGAARPGPATIAHEFLPTLVASGFAPIAAGICYGLAIEVKRAREMGAYRLVELLGRGGMGEVWRAQHRMLARPAAIKLIRPSALGVNRATRALELTKRFEREAQATATLRSPHTIVVYDYGVGQDGTFYYVMELLEGYSLQALVSRHGPVPPERAVHLLVQACQSLAEAHSAGMVHRDIKPANLFACRLGLEVDFVKVLDFGLVKTLGPHHPGMEDLTREDGFNGTPAFMPPELALGTHPVGGQADLYALGCVAYWLLTGQKVFPGTNAIQMVIDHARTAPVPVSQRALQRIPPALEDIVMRCLRKEPAERPATARELECELAALGMAQAWSEEQAPQWWVDHPPAPLERGGDGTEISQLWLASTGAGPRAVDSLVVSAEPA